MLTENSQIVELLDEKEKQNFKKAVEYLIKMNKADKNLTGMEGMVSVVSMDDLTMGFMNPTTSK